jgi:hypothetical protein
MSTKIYLTNLGKYNEGELVGEWLDLPCAQEELQAALNRIDEDRHGEHFIADYECDLLPGLKIDEYDPIGQLNDVIGEAAALEEEELDKLRAVMEWGFYSHGDQLDGASEALSHLNEFSLYPEIRSQWDLAWHWFDGVVDAKMGGLLSIYIDFQRWGEDLCVNSDGCLTSWGWIEYG